MKPRKRYWEKAKENGDPRPIQGQVDSHVGKTDLGGTLIRQPWWLGWYKICLRGRQTQVRSLGWEDSLEKAMATHSSFLAWRIPWTGEHGGLHCTGSQRVGHDQVSNTHSQTPAQHQPGWGCTTLGALPSPAPGLSGRSQLLTLLSHSGFLSDSRVTPHPLPQGLCMCSSLCVEHSSPLCSQGLLSFRSLI